MGHSRRDWLIRATIGPRPLRPESDRSRHEPEIARWVESRCGAVAVGRTYLFPPLSSGGALVVQPWLRFHIPLIEPDKQISRIRLVWGFRCQRFISSFLTFFFFSCCLTAQRAFLPPERIFPSPSCAAAVKAGASSAPPKGLSLTDASTAAGWRRSGGWRRDDPRGACHWPQSIARTTLVFG